VSSLNNKGYALSKLKDFDGAMKCYDDALKEFPSALPILVYKISLLRLQVYCVEA
jgi:tetratricopeptide (TPR) repeat protein